MRFHIIAGVALLAVACAPPSPQPQPNEMEQVVNVTRYDTAAPPGALGNESTNYGEGNITPAERDSGGEAGLQVPVVVAERFLKLIQEREFEQAYGMWDPAAADFTAEQFEQVFSGFETMNAAIGNVSPKGAGDVYEVQLTLTGTTDAGSNYSLTGPLIMSRTGGAGAAGEQGQWRVAKLVLTGNPRVAEEIVDQ